MKRGDIVLVRHADTPAGKARPCVVIQRDSVFPAAAKVTVCPLTSTLRGAARQRPFVAPTSENALRLPSEVEIDWIFTHPIDRIGLVIGMLDRPTMQQVGTALRRWLDL